MDSSFSNILKKLEIQANKASESLVTENSENGKPVILHPRVWSTKEEATKASTDIDYRIKMETIKKLEKSLQEI